MEYKTAFWSTLAPGLLVIAAGCGPELDAAETTSSPVQNTRTASVPDKSPEWVGQCPLGSLVGERCCTCAPWGCQGGVDNSLSGLAKLVNSDIQGAIDRHDLNLVFLAAPGTGDGPALQVVPVTAHDANWDDDTCWEVAESELSAAGVSDDPVQWVPLPVPFSEHSILHARLHIVRVEGALDPESGTLEGIVGGLVVLEELLAAVDHLDAAGLPISKHAIKNIIANIVKADLDWFDAAGHPTPDGVPESASIGLRIQARQVRLMSSDSAGCDDSSPVAFRVTSLQLGESGRPGQGLDVDRVCSPELPPAEPAPSPFDTDDLEPIALPSPEPICAQPYLPPDEPAVGCLSPGAGPIGLDPCWSAAPFPLAAILELYEDTQCRALSPAFVKRVVNDLPAYLLEIEDRFLALAPDALIQAIDTHGGIFPALLAALLGTDLDGLQDEVRRVLQLYLHAKGAGETGPWEEWLVARPILAPIVGALDDLLYHHVLGVTKADARKLLDAGDVDWDEELLAFLSIVHATNAVDGQRAAYLFVANDELEPVLELAADDVTVLEGGEPVEVLSVAPLKSFSKVQFSLSLVLDYSGSMSEQDIAFLEEGLAHLIGVLPPVFRAGVVKFSKDAVVYQPMTEDVGELEEAITAPMEAGATSLYDAMDVGLDELEGEETPFRLEIVFTDGLENDSYAACHRTVSQRARALGVPVFVIGMGAIDVPAMFTMTNETHGCFLYAPSNEDVKAVYQRVAAFIADTWVVTWPSADVDGAAQVTISAETPAGKLHDTLVP